MDNHWRSKRRNWLEAPIEHSSYDLIDRAYEQAGIKRIVPEPDSTTLKPGVAEELFELGCSKGPINFDNIPLPVIEVEMYTDKHLYLIEDMIQPQQPWRDDTYFYGIKVLMIAKQDRIVSLLTVYDSNDSSAGSTELAVVEMIQREDGDFYSHPCFLYQDAEYFCSFPEIEQILLWTAFMWRGIQYRFLCKPISVHVHYERHSSAIIEREKSKHSKSTHIVRVSKRVLFEAERPISVLSIEAAEQNPTKRTIDLDCWGVTGHWRHYKSGKCIWIKPYVKGKSRETMEPYNAKSYLIEDGGVSNART